MRSVFLLLCLFFSLAACDDSDSAIGVSKNDDNDAVPAEDGTGADFTARCGVVTEDTNISDSVTTEELQSVSVYVVDPDTLIVTHIGGETAGAKQLIKLHGIRTNTTGSIALVKRGVDLINQGSVPNAYLVPAGAGCGVTFSDGGLGSLGQLFTSGGQNVSELLIESGAAVPDSGDGCMGSTLAACYSGIQVTAPPVSSKVITNFLWKPISERTGGVAVLISPEKVAIRVEGAITEDLFDTGPSNGRGTTGRSNHPGCQFGSNIKVSFTDAEDGTPVYLSDGRSEVIIPNGCDRVDFTL